MKTLLTWPMWIAACVVAVMTSGVSAAQGFPLRPGEWEISTTSEMTGDPFALLFCFTDETWKKGLTQNPACAIRELSVTSKGIHYLMDCQMKTVQMKGPVDLTFDGMEHMTGKATFARTRKGKTTGMQVVMDYRWKAAACGPADLNSPAKNDR